VSLPHRHPNQILIIVNVKFPLGTPQYSYKAFNDGSNAKSVTLAPGDQIGWFVNVEAGFGYSTPAYQLEFPDTSTLGVDTISVPNGGNSGFFTILALKAATKYSLSVSGVNPPDDPEIIVDPNGIIFTGVALGPQYNVRWTPAGNTMEVQTDAGPWQPFPPAGLPVAIGDMVRFFTVLQPPPTFEIDFPSNSNNNVWESPFDVGQYRYPATSSGANPQSTDNLQVADKRDPSGAVFTFVAALTDGSKQSDKFKLILS
jgi:hypothetical protein